jgi:hypothetical protein
MTAGINQEYKCKNLKWKEEYEKFPEIIGATIWFRAEDFSKYNADEGVIVMLNCFHEIKSAIRTEKDKLVEAMINMIKNEKSLHGNLFKILYVKNKDDAVELLLKIRDCF